MRQLRSVFLYFIAFLLPGMAFSASLELKQSVVRPGEENAVRICGVLTVPHDRSPKISIVGEKNSAIIPLKVWPLKFVDGKSEWISIPMPPEFGIYTVRVEIPDEKNTLISSFASVPEKSVRRPQPNDFILGVHMHIDRYPADIREKMAQLAEECGIAYARCGVAWNDIEKTHGQWDFSLSDDIFNTLQRHNIEPMFLLFGYRPWSTAKNWTPIDPKGKDWQALPEPVLFAEYAARCAKRYGKKIRYWEVQNEVDWRPFANYSLKDYLRLFNTVSSAIKQEQPDARVMNGGFATIEDTESSVEPDYACKFLKQVQPGNCDILALHLHHDYQNYRKLLLSLPQIMKRSGVNMPFFMNETAYAASPGFGDTYHQAETLWKKLLFAWKEGSIGYVWYNLRDKPEYSENSGEGSMGLLTRDFQPKPVYAAYHTLIKYFGGAKFINSFRDGEDGEFFLFRAANGDYLVPFWTNEKQSSKLWLISGAGNDAFLVDLWGNRRKADVKNGFVAIEPGTRPVLLCLPNAAKMPALAGEMLSFDRELWVPYSGTKEFKLTLHNIFPERWQGNIILLAPACLNVEPAQIAFNLEPESYQIFSCRFSGNPSDNPPEGSTGILEVRLCSDKWSHNGLKYPVWSVVQIGKNYREKPDFALNRKDQVVSLIPSSAETQKFFWKGPEDLSAQAWLKRDAQFISFRVVVRDDIHQQPFDRKMIWKADSIQLGLAIPRQKGNWQIGFARKDDGSVQKFCWQAPEGFNPKEIPPSMVAEITRDETGKQTVYELKLRMHSFGLNGKNGAEGIRINMIINDSDLAVRETMLRLADGMGEGIFNTQRWPVVCF